MKNNTLDLIQEINKSYANISASSSNFGKLRLLQQLVGEIEDLNLDNASRVKIKLWLDKHKKQLEAE